MNLAFDFLAPQIWTHIPIEDPRARAVYDRHYSRQSVGEDGIVAPGYRFLLWHEGPTYDPITNEGAAIWAIVRNRFRGQWYFRNSIFRNESLILAATTESLAMWVRRYKALPPEDLISEIDIDATADRRSQHNPPGHCYAMAGWEWFKSTLAGHGRPRKAVYRAPRSL